MKKRESKQERERTMMMMSVYPKTKFVAPLKTISKKKNRTEPLFDTCIEWRTYPKWIVSS
jgi:hypothetical protein